MQHFEHQASVSYPITNGSRITLSQGLARCDANIYLNKLVFSTVLNTCMRGRRQSQEILWYLRYRYHNILLGDLLFG
jgi:hypothetical protein